jgi:Holliday junction resolvase RusA-like endonuclease
VVKITIPYAPLSVSKLNKHWSYRDKERKTWEWLLQNALKTGDRIYLRARKAQLGKVRVSVCVSHARFFDHDNLYGCLKPICDALKQLGYIVDDRPQFFELGEITQQKCPKAKAHTEITLEPV